MQEGKRELSEMEGGSSFKGEMANEEKVAEGNEQQGVDCDRAGGGKLHLWRT